MKNDIIAPLLIISLLLAAGPSCSARLLDNDLFISATNPSTFGPNLNSVAHGPVEKDAVPCDQENSPWFSYLASSSTNSMNKINKLLFRLSSAIQNTRKADELPSSNEDEGVLNLRRKVLPSQVNSMQMTQQRLSKSRHRFGTRHMEISEQRLSKSRHRRGVLHMQMNAQQLSKSRDSPGVGHMQISRNYKSQSIHHNNGDDKRKKQKLGSTPSAGAVWLSAV